MTNQMRERQRERKLYHIQAKHCYSKNIDPRWTKSVVQFKGQRLLCYNTLCSFWAPPHIFLQLLILKYPKLHSQSRKHQPHACPRVAPGSGLFDKRNHCNARKSRRFHLRRWLRFNDSHHIHAEAARRDRGTKEALMHQHSRQGWCDQALQCKAK